MIDKDSLIARLRELDAQLGPKQHAEIVVRVGDHNFDWSSLEQSPSCKLPGHHHGQDKDIRYATDGKDGLHGRYFSDRVAFHLDQVDACANPIGHLIQDTAAMPGVLFGGLVGALLGGESGLALGALVGGLLGSAIPSRSLQSYECGVLALHSQYRKYAA